MKGQRKKCKFLSSTVHAPLEFSLFSWLLQLSPVVLRRTATGTLLWGLRVGSWELQGLFQGKSTRAVRVSGLTQLFFFFPYILFHNASPSALWTRLTPGQVCNLKGLYSKTAAQTGQQNYKQQIPVISCPPPLFRTQNKEREKDVKVNNFTAPLTIPVTTE